MSGVVKRLTHISLDPAPRGAIELPAYYKSHKDQKFLCKAHGNEGCKSCCESTLSTHLVTTDGIVGWKKQVSRLPGI